jgi:tetratricopeptide (TPR) repeat protein
LDLERISAIDQTDHFALYLLGCCFRSLKKPREAIVTLTRAIDVSRSKVAKYFVRRGLSYSDIKDYELAMGDFTRALEIRPQYPKVRLILKLEMDLRD